MKQNMNETEVQNMINAALVPLKAQIEVLSMAVALLTKEQNPTAPEIPASVKQMQQLFAGVPSETMKALGAQAAILDPKMPWARIIRENGQSISIKLGNDLRFRIRNESQELVKEFHAPLNALASTLAKLAQ